MKKNPIIFIAMLIALAFTSCQMNTDDSVVIPPAPTTEATYTITVTGDQTNGSVTLSKTEAKAGETVKITIEPKSGYKFETKINGSDMGYNGSEKKSYEVTMPASNVTITVEFVKITDGGSPTTPTTPTTDGGEDNNGDEPPVTTNEYTVSVASGKTNGISFSIDGSDWKTLDSNNTVKFNFEDGKKIYVKTVNYADNFYKVTEIDYTYSDGATGIVAKENVNDTYPCIRMKATNVSLSVKTENVTDFKGGTIQFADSKEALSGCDYIFDIQVNDPAKLNNVKVGYLFDSGLNLSNISGVKSIDYKNKPTDSSYVAGCFYQYNETNNVEPKVDNNSKYHLFIGINEYVSFSIKPSNIVVFCPNYTFTYGSVTYSMIYTVKKDGEVWTNNKNLLFLASQL